MPPQPKVSDMSKSISKEVDMTGKEGTAFPILEEYVPPHQVGFSPRVEMDVVVECSVQREKSCQRNT